MPDCTDTPPPPLPRHARPKEDPRRLWLQRWIERGGILEGASSAQEVPGDFPRLAEACCEAIRDPLVWRAVGLLESTTASARRLRRHWLNLQAHAHAALRCNRCLDTVHAEVRVRRRFLVVEDEASAERLDEPQQEDFDVIADAQAFDLLGLLEDELLLALPIVPMHAQCALPTAPAERTVEATQATRLGAALGKEMQGEGIPGAHRSGASARGSSAVLPQGSSGESEGASPPKLSGESPDD